MRTYTQGIHLSLDVETRTWQAGFVLPVQLARLRAQEVVEPRALGLQLDAARDVHDRKIHPRRSVADGADLVTDVRARVLGHSVVQVIVRVEVEHVLRDRVVVADVDQVAALAMLNLERDTARARRDDRLARVQRF